MAVYRGVILVEHDGHAERWELIRFLADACRVVFEDDDTPGHIEELRVEILWGSLLDMDGEE